jgi:hypothetical protein
MREGVGVRAPPPRGGGRGDRAEARDAAREHVWRRRREEREEEQQLAGGGDGGSRGVCQQYSGGTG